MFSSLTFWARGVSTQVQAFGKLPFYGDYLRWITTNASEDWRSWLVSNYPEEVLLRNGRQPFCFRNASGKGIVSGLIEPSDDGVREFPFSIFVVLDRNLRSNRHFEKIMCSFWQSLDGLRRQLNDCESVDDFNRFIRNQKLHVRKRDLNVGVSPEIMRSMTEEYRSDSTPALFLFDGCEGHTGAFT